VTLQTIAEGFSRAGVPVFAADIKGDLSGIAAPGEAREAFVKRAKDIGFEYETDEFPAMFWDLFGEQGHPIRATVFELGPLLLSRILDLNDVQEGVINIVFRYADDEFGKTDAANKGLVDLKDLREVLSYISASDEAKAIGSRYGNVAPATVGAVQRQLLVLENQGATGFFGEPALDINDFMKKDRDGRGYINILAADKLMANPRLYATFLLWLLSDMFEKLPEVGDLDKPKLVFFFDEAHLLFTDAPKALLDKIEQVVRLIRSKGVGVYFVTQNPLDIPDTVLGQLGNRAARIARLHPARPESGARGCGDVSSQSEAQHRAGHHRARQGRGAGVLPRRQRHAVHGRSHADPPAVGASRAGVSRGAQGDHCEEPAARQIRYPGRSGISVRDPAEAR
jgi:DNA helicase HerA-like ATPase